MTAAERDLLAAVLEALDIPNPATSDDEKVHDSILRHRAIDARIALRGVLADGDDPAWSASYLRAKLAEMPAVGYRAWGQP